MEKHASCWYRASNLWDVSDSHSQSDVFTYIFSRWLRLLFTREFSIHDAMVLWDGILACDPQFHIAEWICVAMLVRIRNSRESLLEEFNITLIFPQSYPPTTVSN